MKVSNEISRLSKKIIIIPGGFERQKVNRENSQRRQVITVNFDEYPRKLLYIFASLASISRGNREPRAH